MKKELIKTIIITCFIPMGLIFADKPVAPALPALPEEDGRMVDKVEKKAFLGIVTSSVRSSTAIQLGITPGIGLTVESVVKESAAAVCGIEKYDILLDIDGQMLTSGSHLSTMLSLHKPGDEVVFSVYRKGTKIALPVVLGEKNKKRNMSFEFDFKMDQLEEKLHEMAEKHELKKYLGEEANLLEEKIKAALEKYKYHVEDEHEDHDHHYTSRTSIINSGQSRLIESSEDGTLILEPVDEDESKLIVIDNEGSVLFKGKVSESAKELNDLESWVKTRFLKMNKDNIRITVVDEIDVDEDVDTRDVE